MYQPEYTLLKKYADVLIQFALWSGKGIRKGDVINLAISESAKPFLDPLLRSILESGGHYLLQYLPEDVSRTFFDLATEEQLHYVPRNFLRERVKASDHFVGIISTNNKFELKGVDSKKIMNHSKTMKFYMEERNKKENEGKMTWTLALYGTDAMAKEARMSLKEYWEQIILACYLDHKDPIAAWREIFTKLEKYKSYLNSLQIEKVRVEGKDVDLEIGIGKGRQWLGGSGRNIPSFELFISPDWRETNGWIQFDQPLYRYGNLVTGIKLRFEKGKVVEVSAKQNEKLLKDMIAVENADKVGEFSLTDHRLSRITKFMAETLFDENIGGMYGNTHIALGQAYKDSYTGDPATVSNKEWKKMGYNESVVHTDMVSTTDRTVTAYLTNGQKKVIYKKGEYIID